MIILKIVALKHANLCHYDEISSIIYNFSAYNTIFVVK